MLWQDTGDNAEKLPGCGYMRRVFARQTDDWTPRLRRAYCLSCCHIDVTCPNFRTNISAPKSSSRRKWFILLIGLTLVLSSVRQGCKRDLSLRDREQDIWFLVRDETETKTFLQFHETARRDRDVWFLLRGETETETLQGRDRDVFRDLQPVARCETMKGDVQIKTIYTRTHQKMR